MFLAALDFSINVNLPRFRADLGETLVSVQLIIILYHGSRSGSGFVVGALADHLGVKRPLIAGIVFYSASVGLISLMTTLTPIVLLRIPQGIGVAILFTLAPALVAKAFGPSNRGSALGVTLASMGAGTFAGTLGGGYLGQEFGWPTIFWGRIPIGIALLLACTFLLKGEFANPEPRTDRGKFDFNGAVLIFTSLFSLVLAMSFARVDGWTSPVPVALFAIALISGAGLARGLTRGVFTIVPTGLITTRGFRSGATSNLMLTTASFVMWFLFPFYVADVLNRSGFVLGAFLALMAGSGFVGSTVSGWLADRIGDRLVTVIGSSTTALGLLFAAMPSATPTLGTVALSTVVIGFGFGIHQAAVYTLSLRNVRSSATGSASASLTVSQTVGTVLSIAVMTSLLSWRQDSTSASFLDAYRFTYFVAAAVALASGLIVVRIGSKTRTQRDS